MLSTQGQPDVNLHRLTSRRPRGRPSRQGCAIPTTDWSPVSTRVNHNTIVYQYRSCSQRHCVVPEPAHYTHSVDWSRQGFNHNTILYQYRSCSQRHCVVPAHYTHSVIRCRPISRRLWSPTIERAGGVGLTFEPALAEGVEVARVVVSGSSSDKQGSS